MYATINNQMAATRHRKKREIVNMEIKDIRTEYQKKMDKQREVIEERYNAYRNAYPDAKDNRIFETIAAELGMTRDGIRSICIRHGITQPVRTENNDN